MQLNEYQQKAIQFAAYENPEYCFMALCEEVGEVMGKLAKFNRKTGCSFNKTIENVNKAPITTGELKADLVKELGDVLWQLSACCHEIGVSLNEVAYTNIAKLAARQANGTIVGEGDNR